MNRRLLIATEAQTLLLNDVLCYSRAPGPPGLSGNGLVSLALTWPQLSLDHWDVLGHSH